jgi:DNA-binding MarR family transcriptional regulator
MITEAVASHGVAGASINEIAEELGIDQSGASRMVGQAVARGYLAKSSASDARRRIVVVTAAGHALIAQAHLWQEGIFSKITHDWSSSEVKLFTDLMNRLNHAGEMLRSEHDEKRGQNRDSVT